MLCEGKIADLALVTVEDDQFWTNELLDLQFVDVPELQASPAGHIIIECMHMCMKPMLRRTCWCWAGPGTVRSAVQCTQKAVYDKLMPLQQQYQHIGIQYYYYYLLTFIVLVANRGPTDCQCQQKISMKIKQSNQVMIKRE